MNRQLTRHQTKRDATRHKDGSVRPQFYGHYTLSCSGHPDHEWWEPLLTTAEDAKAKFNRTDGRGWADACHGGAVTAVIGVLDLLVVALLLLLDKVQVQTQPVLSHVALGMPLNWVSQDRGLDPPLPYSAGFISPWENPTTVDWLP